ncbi:MAG: hypothetical protein GTO14_05530 [Anaerolineales bacterium]|nr:hypothetical protein [Anaerolineales bacterium]
MVALYRPGPIEKIPDYIRRMHGQEKVEYLHHALEPILKETYGITVYQEQIMYTAMNLAGYSASEADNLRKAVAKKKAHALKQQRKTFVAGAVGNDIPEDTANTIFDQWETFARYGFPKGHAADYAVICVQTAYLKANYPREYMTALLSVFKHDSDKVSLYIADCRRMGFDVLPPDINKSGLDFQIEGREDSRGSIRFGLGAVKNVGEGAIEKILEVRQDGGNFKTLSSFAQRVDLRQVGRRALESLVRVGVFDSLGSRIRILDSIERLMSISSSHFRAAEVGQMSFFSASSDVSDAIDVSPAPSDVPRRRQLGWEKDLLGVYISDHPLTPYMEAIARVVTHYSAELADADHGHSVTVAGEISHVRPYQTRSGREMGFVTLEDLQGKIELVIFSNVWAKVSTWLQPDMIAMVKGRVDRERGEPKILVDDISADIPEVNVEFDKGGVAPISVDLPEDLGAVSDPNPTELHEVELAPIPDGPPWEDGLDSGAVLPSLENEGPASTEQSAAVTLLSSAVDRQLTEMEESEEAEASEPSSGNGKDRPVSPEESLRASEYSPVRPQRSEEVESQMVIVVIKSTGDRRKDTLRLRRVHGLLTSFPGRDKFTFQVFEHSRRYHLEFPNSTTGYCPELHAQLLALLGEGAVRLEPMRMQ